MSGHAPKITTLALSALMFSASFAQASSPAREIPQWMHDRYGHQGQTEQVRPRPVDSGNGITSNFCSGSLGQIARGNIVERSFGNGRGRISINLDSPTSDPTIGINVEIATKGDRLPEPSC